MVNNGEAWKDPSWQAGVVMMTQQWVMVEATSEVEVLSGVTIDNLILRKKDPLAIWAALYKTV